MKSLDLLLKIAEKNNIAEDLDEQRLAQIGIICKEGYGLDLGTCNDHFTKIEEYIEIAKQVVVEKTSPWQGAANAKYPLLTVASMQFNARAYPALVPSSGIVKAQHFGEDVGGQKSDRAVRVAGHMSYQLTEKVEDWQENMDNLLLQIPIVGVMFKKTYRSMIKRRPKSDLLMTNQLVVNNDTTKTLESCPRVTEIIKRYPHQIKANIDAEFWIDTDIVFDDEDKEEPEDVLEQHVLIDIYDDGNKEPYIVTIHEKSGNVLRIKAGFDEDTIFVNYKDDYKSVGEIRRDIENQNLIIEQKNAEAEMIAANVGRKVAIIPTIDMISSKTVKVLCVEKLQYYTEYGYLPAFDGKFYKSGLGDLVASLSGLIDTNLNQMLDAGTLANMQGGLQQKRAKGPAGQVKMKPGFFAPIDTGGLPIKESIFLFDFKGPSGVLFSLLGMLIDAARDITSIKDIMVGEAPQGETATTTMIKREEGMRVFSAIYKRLHRALTKEFKKLYTLNRKYLSEKEYFLFGDTKSYAVKEDYEDDQINISPVADPNESTMQERMIKAQALMQFMGDPDADQAQIRKNYLVSLGIDPTEYDSFFPGAPENVPPTPEMLKTKAETEKINEETENLKVEKAVHYAKAIDLIASAESKELGPQLEIYKQALEGILDGVQQSGAEGIPGSAGNESDLPVIPQAEAGTNQGGILE